MTTDLFVTYWTESKTSRLTAEVRVCSHVRHLENHFNLSHMQSMILMADRQIARLVDKVRVFFVAVNVHAVDTGCGLARFSKLHFVPSSSTLAQFHQSSVIMSFEEQLMILMKVQPQSKFISTAVQQALLARKRRQASHGTDRI